MLNQNHTLQLLLDSYREGYSLPADFYQNAALYEADLAAVFYQSWIYAGHISQVGESGQYFTLEFGDESIIVVKGKDSIVRAFANVCRHRGSRVCLEKQGKAGAFVCPYHAWTYELDGRLRSRRAMSADFKKEEFGLKEVGISIFHGLIFINLDKDAPDLERELAGMSSAMDIYQIDQTRVAKQQTFSVDANWKLAIENFMECYHCGPAHAEYSQSHALHAPKDYEDMRPAMLEQAEKIGYQIDSIDQSNPEDSNRVQHFYNRSAMYEKYVTGSKSGEPVAPLLGRIPKFGGGAADLMFGPATYAIFYADHAVLYRFLPTAVQKTDMEIFWLVREDAEEGKDYQLDTLTWLWTVTTEADKTIILNNQRGVNSQFYEPGPLSEMESFITVFTDWYLAKMQTHLNLAY
ncbi:MAG: aromatic ring-hydroxylating dioxygenase subunit alpha [Granulosicoccus sp.]|nr:aromatic ring-hydroxylating dioxygenase subunit alpha [Granulosicoccus sp.]